MKMHEDIFEYHFTPDNHSKYLYVSAGIKNEEQLYEAYSSYFPEYFGRNWDALIDCLEDFNWVSCEKIYIVHNDLPLIDSRDALQVYIEILCDCYCKWKIDPFSKWKNYLLSRGLSSGAIAHELHVVFPEDCRDMVEPIMRAYVATEGHQIFGMHKG